MSKRAERLIISLFILFVLAVGAQFIDPAPTAPPGSEANHSSAEATLERVIDGDTIMVSDGRSVRLIGVDAPELRHGSKPAEPYGMEASAHLRQLIGTSKVQLERDISETDKYGRLLRYVYVADENLSVRMARDGYAKSLTIPPDVRFAAEIRNAVSEAREAHRGLWSSK